MQLSEYSFIFTPCTTFSGNWSYFMYSEAACKIRDDLNFWFSSEIASTVFEIYLQIYKISSWEVLSKLAFADWNLRGFTEVIEVLENLRKFLFGYIGRNGR